ncbi:MAG: acetyl-CoA carboxylase, carboxyltransferase subunit beta [Erysipelotrichaceae bacterium]|nr:acetyl-CoA carboxylase, carboxyltransferase subunit beta [Erysipelotrichaceae bacterium]
MNIFKLRHDKLNIFHQNRRKEAVKKEIPDHVFKKCPECENDISVVTLRDNLYVCPNCGYHFKISANERIRQLCDDFSFKETDAKYITKNINNFPDYDKKLNAAKSSTGMNEAVVCGIGKINGQPLALAVMDSNFMMGSMGSVVGEKITRLIELADKKKLPLLISCTSGGARMQEGIVSLMQMAKTSAALKRFSNNGGLYISLLTHPTTGGVSASFAMLGDIILAEPKCLVGFAGRRVIEKTINEKLPDNFQTAEFVLENGFIDRIVERKDLKSELNLLLRMHGGK